MLSTPSTSPGVSVEQPDEDRMPLLTRFDMVPTTIDPSEVVPESAPDSCTLAMRVVMLLKATDCSEACRVEPELVEVRV